MTRVQARLNRVIDNNPIAYLESIFTLYLSDHNLERIQEHTITLSNLQKSIYKCHTEVLQLSSVGQDLSHVESVKKQICTTVSWI